MTKLILVDNSGMGGTPRGQTVHTGKKEYVVHLHGNYFFKYMDGHYGKVEFEQGPTRTDSISEALRMLEYARKDLSGGAEIVVISEVVMETISHDILNDLVRESALAKLTEQEKNILGLA